MSAVNCIASVALSGETIIVALTDFGGSPTNVLSYATTVTELIDVRAAGGTYTLEFPPTSGHITSALAVGAPAATVQAALEALSSIGSGNISVVSEYPYQATFLNTLNTPQPLFTVDKTGLSATSSAAPLTAGTTAQQILDASTNFAKVGAAWTATGFGSGSGWKVVADGSGLNTAEWTITGLATGNYNIYYANSGPTGSGNATTVPWRFFDGSAPRVKTIVNQQALVPDNFALPGDASDAFQLLATVYISSGTLRVLVTDQVAGGDIGKLVCVNKIGIVPVDPAVNLILDGAHTPAYLFFAGGSWGSFAADWNNSQHFSNVSGGSATWLFLGLIPGSTYKVQSQWGEQSNRSTNCVYSIIDSDGTTVLGTSSVNQQVAPAGGQTLTDSLSQTFTFQDLGTYTPTGTSLRLVLPIATGGNYTIASGALVQLQTAAGYAEPVSSSVANLSTGPPTITINGSDTRTLVSPNWPTSQNPPANFMGFLVPGSPILTTDTVTISISGSSIGTSAGTLPTVTNQAVVNSVGKSLGRTMPGSRPLKVGWNFAELGQGFVPLYANMVKNNVGWQTLASAADLTADLLPRYTSNTGNYFMQFGQSGPPNETSSEGFPLWPQTGTTTFILDGAVTGFPTILPQPGTTMAFQSMDTGHATGNTIKINFAVDGSNTTFAPQFNFYAPTGLMDICDDADTGRFSIAAGTWTVQSGGWNGHYHRNSKLATDKAVFTFGAIPAGNWEVAICWVGNAANTTTANVVVKEAGVSVASYTVDQTTSPSATVNDYNHAVFGFDLGTDFVSTGGIITVEITGGTDGWCLADAVRIKCDSTLGSPIVPMTDFKVYPPDPDIDPASPPKFHPIFLRKFAGVGSLRSMILFDSNFGCYTELSDYASQTQLYYGGEWGQNQYTITQVETWSDPNGDWTANADICPALFTVTPINGAPLPLTKGFKGQFPTPLVVKYTDWTSGNGHVIDFSLLLNWIEYDPVHMATNQFACGNFAFGPHALTTLNPTAPCTISFGRSGIPIADYFELCVDVGCTVHLNLTSTVSQTCIDDVAALYTSIVPVGTKFILEISNEPWNFRFPDFGYFGALDIELGLGSELHAYAKVASDRHGWMTTALGSRSGELIRAFNCQLDDFSTGAQVLDYCNTNSKPVDLILVSDYLGPYPALQPGLDATYELCTAGHSVDFVDAWLNVSTRFSAQFIGWQATAVAQSTAAPLSRHCDWGIYEGGQYTNGMGGSTPTINRQSYAGRYHPLEYQVTISYMAMMQFYGATYYNHFCIDQSPGAFALFGVYYGYDALAGKGDGSDGKHNNLPDIAGVPPGVVDFNTAVTPIGQAYDDWNSGAIVATTYTLTAPAPSTGKPGTASADFTVQCDAIPSSPVTITPAVGSGGGGTFTPSSLLVSDANPHTFKYTPFSTGNKIIACTNDGGLTDPGAVTFTAYSLAVSPGAQEVAVSTAATMTATLTGGTGSLTASTDVGTLSTTTPTSGTPFTLTTPSSGSGHATVTVTGPGGTSAVARVYFPVSGAQYPFSPIGDRMNFLPSNYRINVYNGLQVPTPPNKITLTLSPYTVVSGSKVPGSDVPIIAPSDGSPASAAIPASSYGAAAKITGNTNLSGDLACSIDLSGVAGLKPGGTISFYLQVCGTTINPPDGKGLVVLTIPIDKAGVFTGTVCLDGLLPLLN